MPEWTTNITCLHFSRVLETYIQYPTREDWDKLDVLFDGIGFKYDDYVYKFKLPPKLTDVWDDINFYDRTYKKLWMEKYNEKCKHPTMKPYQLIKRLIECSTDENDIILDIFMGTGMTAKVCKDTKRNYYGCELDPNYINKSLAYLWLNLYSLENYKNLKIGYLEFTSK